MLEINTNPSPKDLKWFGVGTGGALGVLGAILWLKTSVLFGMGSSPTLASKVVWGLAIVFPILYYSVPALRRPLYVGFMVGVFPIGWVVSNVILAATYYLVVTPIGLALRLLGKDPMERTLRPDAGTYWTERRTGDDPAGYFKQF
jgi:hypothetical protein